MTRFKDRHGGEAGIRTLDTGLSPYNGLANRRLRPLGHLTVETRCLVAEIRATRISTQVPSIRRTGADAEATRPRASSPTTVHRHRATTAAFGLWATSPTVFASRQSPVGLPLSTEDRRPTGVQHYFFLPAFFAFLAAFFEAFFEALSGFSIFCCTSAGASLSAWTGLLQ